MPVTVAQYEQVLRRLDLIESSLNLVISAISKLATLDQLRQLTVIRQAATEDLRARVTALENNVETLQALLRT